MHSHSPVIANLHRFKGETVANVVILFFSCSLLLLEELQNYSCFEIHFL
jgi:hypothetical protein